MPDEDEAERRSDYVLRALAASEIAESAPTVALRQSFLDLSAQWLGEAQQPASDDGRPAGEEDG